MNTKELKQMNVKELKQHCKTMGIGGYSGLRKKEIIELIQNKNNISTPFSKSTLQIKKIAQLKTLCENKSMNVEGCQTKQDYISCILKHKTQHQDVFKPILYDLDSEDDLSDLF